MGGVKAIAKSATESTIHFVEESIMAIPVAEQISLELVMWGTPTTIVLIALLYGWLYGLGAFAQRHVRVSTSVGGTLQDIISKLSLIHI